MGDWSVATRTLEGRYVVMCGRVVTCEIEPACCGATRHSNNTAELSVEALKLLTIRGNVPGWVPRNPNCWT